MRRILEYAGAVLGLIAAALLLRLTRYEIAEESMIPALAPGDWLIGIKRPRTVVTGQIVVFEHPRRPELELVKRVAATPGERIHGRTMKRGEMWVEGDAPGSGSVDSRTLGAIPLANLEARLVMRYKPLPFRLV